MPMVFITWMRLTNDGEAVHVAGAFANVMRELGQRRCVARQFHERRLDAHHRLSRRRPHQRWVFGCAGEQHRSDERRDFQSGRSTTLVQDFTTGENDAGYTLGEIEITLQGAGASTPPTVTLHSGSATGPKVADFTGPSSLVTGSASNYTYVPTTTVPLSRSTIYFVVVQGGDGLWAYTTSNYEEFAAPGWIIGNVSLTRAENSTGIFAIFLLPAPA